MKNHNKIAGLFLGPKSENRPFFKEIIDLIMNDYIFWRRNYHPKDPAPISYKETQSLETKEFHEKFTHELFNLLADLKLDPPFFSPRYMAHMISETALPGLIAYISTLMYNPNNVSSESSPITLKYEIMAGKQFAKLFNMNEEKAFGHIASGGTLANYESLFFNAGLRFLPLSFLMVLEKNKINHSLGDLTSLLNIEYENYNQLISDYSNICIDNKIEYREYEDYTLGYLGLRDFEKNIKEILKEELPDIKIIIPSTGHYSWSRGVKLMGFGRSSLIKVPMNKDFQMDMKALDNELSIIKDKKQIILQTVGVYGTTEFGSFDAIHEIVQLKNKYKSSLYFPIHVDAAYGGYFSTLFHETPNDKQYPFFSRLREKHESISQCDSITIDPHKLGYTPYGAGGFVFKHGHLKDFIAENAQYCFSPKSVDAPVDIELGKYILEGSKPGASAAAVYFNHKLIPLNYQGHGQIMKGIIDAAQNFHVKLVNENNKDEKIKLIPITNPQSNVLCFFVKLENTKDLSEANKHTINLAKRFGVKKIDSIGEYDYIVSNTTYNLNDSNEVPESLACLNINVKQLSLVRMVFMNQFHEETNSKGISYIDDFISKAKQEFVNI